MFTIEIFVGSSVKRILLETAKISTGTPCGGLKCLSLFCRLADYTIHELVCCVICVKGNLTVSQSC